MRDFGSGDESRPDIRFSDIFAIIGVPTSVMIVRGTAGCKKLAFTPDII